MEDALRDVEGALALNQRNADAHYLRALIFSDRGRRWEAFEEFNNAIELGPNCGDFYFGRAIEFHKIKDFRSALVDFDCAIKLNPSDPGFHMSQAASLSMLGEKQAAIEAYTTGIKFGTELKNLDLYYRERARLEYDLNRREDAIRSYTQALKIKREWMAFNNRGMALEDLGRMDEALHDVDQAIKLKPDEAQLYFNRAHVQFSRGKVEDGLRNCAKNIQLSFTNPKSE